MKILAIDDAPTSLASLEWIARRAGHEVIACGDPEEGVRRMDADIDLVISDVSMPGLDGFAVADEASARLGRSPPRTLLVSGLHHPAEMAAAPSERVIGLVTKPLSLLHLQRVLEMIEQSRKVCPGVIGPFCPLRDHALAHGDESVIRMDLHCRSERYACCPHYNEQAGREFRGWIAATHAATSPE
jgi:CheY-like chemotaxis protein